MLLIIKFADHDSPIGRVLIPVEDQEKYRWGIEHHLQALTIDAVNNAARSVAQVHVKNRIPEPPSFPRPGTKPRRMTREDLERVRELAKRKRG